MTTALHRNMSRPELIATLEIAERIVEELGEVCTQLSVEKMETDGRVYDLNHRLEELAARVDESNATSQPRPVRTWSNRCDHAGDEVFLGSFKPGTATLYWDVALFKCSNGMHLCFRYGNSGEDYISPGELRKAKMRIDSWNDSENTDSIHPWTDVFEYIHVQLRLMLTPRGEKT